MTKMLDEAVARIRQLPDEEQDHLAETLLALAELARRGPIYKLSPDERAAVDAGIEEADRGEFAGDDEVAAVWKKFGL